MILLHLSFVHCHHVQPTLFNKGVIQCFFDTQHHPFLFGGDQSLIANQLTQIEWVKFLQVISICVVGCMRERKDRLSHWRSHYSTKGRCKFQNLGSKKFHHHGDGGPRHSNHEKKIRLNYGGKRDRQKIGGKREVGWKK